MTQHEESFDFQTKPSNIPPTYSKRWQTLKEIEKTQWIKNGLKKINLSLNIHSSPKR